MKIRRVEDEVPDPVFLLGFYRSGTTLMEQVLSAHSRIATSDEEDLIPQVLRELGRMTPRANLHWTDQLAALGASEISQLRRYYWERVAAAKGSLRPEAFFLDKTALNTINIGFIHALFPTAKVFFALRDPRDVCLSCFMQAFVPNVLTAHFLNWDATARFYDAVLAHWESMRSSLDLRSVVIRYEYLVADLRAEIVPALHALGLDWEPSMARYYEAARKKVLSTPSFAEVTRPLYRSAQGRWRRYERRFDPVLGVLQPHITRYGYCEVRRATP